MLVLACAIGGTQGQEPIVWDEAAVRHSLSRTSFGASDEDVRRFQAMPLERAVETLLDEAAAAAVSARMGA